LIDAIYLLIQDKFYQLPENMSYLLTFVLIVTLFGCQYEVDPEPTGKSIESTGKFNRMPGREFPTKKAFRQDINKTYHDLADRPWVMAKPQEPYKDINFSVFGNE